MQVYILPPEGASEDLLKQIRPTYKNFNRAYKAARALGITIVTQTFQNYKGMGNVKFEYPVLTSFK